MRPYLVHLTIAILGENALDALNRVINPDGAARDITNIRVEEDYLPSVHVHTNQAGEEIGLDDEVPEPSPVPNAQPELVQDEPEAEPEEAPCAECPEPGEAMPLPKDIPYIKTLSDAGETLDSVILLTQNFTLQDKVKGMGAIGARKVRDYLVQTGRLSSAGTEDTREEHPTVTPGPPVHPLTPPTPTPAATIPAEEEEVRQALAEVCRVHKLPAMKKILKDLGCSGGLGDLDKGRYPEALAMARALLG